LSIFLFGAVLQYGDLASAKGVAITAVIVAGVVGASLLVWFGPQGQPGGTSFGQDVTADNIDSFRSDEAFGSIYTRHQTLADDVDFNYDRWKRDDIDSSRMLRAISGAKAESAEMRGAFEAATPPQEWQSSFGHYAEALRSFSSYLDEMERIVRAGEKNPDETALQGYRQESERHIDLATEAIPVSPISAN
jgi:hypothetical protein